MTRDLLAELTKRKLVTDGAMGTMLFAKGLPQGACPEEWVVSHPAEVTSIHQAYAEADSDVVLTNTFGGNAIKLKNYDAADNAAEWNQKAAELARKAVGGTVFVGGSMGPTGEFLPPLGTMTEEAAYNAFKEQAVALETGGVDAIFVETMSIIEEAVLAVKAAKENTRLPVVATMTFEQKKRGYRTMMGVTPEAAVQQLQAAGVDVVGTNCGAGPDLTVGVLTAMRAVTDNYLAGKPNAGLPEVRDGQNVYTMTPEEMVVRMRPMLDLDIRLIGGCCGTTPEFIKHIAAMVKSS